VNDSGGEQIYEREENGAEWFIGPETEVELEQGHSCQERAHHKRNNFKGVIKGREERSTID
jgi:hypothetical protein